MPAIYDVDISAIVPAKNSVFMSTQTSFTASFNIHGNGVYGYIYRWEYNNVVNLSGSIFGSVYQNVFDRYAMGGAPYEDGTTVSLTVSGYPALSAYVGGSIYESVFQLSQMITFIYQNDTASPYSFYTVYTNIEDANVFHTGDSVILYETANLGGSHAGLYVHVYGNGYADGQKSYIRLYAAREDALIGSAENTWIGTVGKTYYLVRSVKTPRIPLTLVPSVPEIDLATTYADQTLTFYAGDNYYLCKNSQINLHFTLSGINSVITRYRVLLYSAQYGPVSGFEPTYTGEWIYNQDMYYQVSGQLNNSNLYIAVEAYDNLGVHYTTTRQQYSSGQYQYALAISFDYTQYVPTPSIGCTATYDCINGRDIITLDGLNALYGQVNTFATYGSSNYTQVSNFGSTGNTAISINDTDSLLYYPKTTSDAVPLYYFAPTGANGFPMFLWQTPNGTFSNTSGNLFEFSTGSIANNDYYYYLRVYMKNNHIYRQTNAGANTVGIETVDDGEFYPDPNVIYLVAITDTRVVFRPFIYMLHNKLNFGFIAGQNVL